MRICRCWESRRSTLFILRLSVRDLSALTSLATPSPTQTHFVNPILDIIDLVVLVVNDAKLTPTITAGATGGDRLSRLKYCPAFRAQIP